MFTTAHFANDDGDIVFRPNDLDAFEKRLDGILGELVRKDIIEKFAYLWRQEGILCLVARKGYAIFRAMEPLIERELRRQGCERRALICDSLSIESLRDYIYLHKNDRGFRITIADDSLLFGRSIAGIVLRIRDLFAVPADKISVTALYVNEQRVNNRRDEYPCLIIREQGCYTLRIPDVGTLVDVDMIEPVRLASEADVRVFSHNIPRALAALFSPNNAHMPVFRIHDGYEARAIWTRALNRGGISVKPVLPGEEEFGVECRIVNAGMDGDVLSAIRLYYNSDLGVYIVPIVVLPIYKGEDLEALYKDYIGDDFPINVYGSFSKEADYKLIGGRIRYALAYSAVRRFFKENNTENNIDVIDIGIENKLVFNRIMHSVDVFDTMPEYKEIWHIRAALDKLVQEQKLNALENKIRQITPEKYDDAKFLGLPVMKEKAIAETARNYKANPAFGIISKLGAMMLSGDKPYEEKNTGGPEKNFDYQIKIPVTNLLADIKESISYSDTFTNLAGLLRACDSGRVVPSTHVSKRNDGPFLVYSAIRWGELSNARECKFAYPFARYGIVMHNDFNDVFGCDKKTKSARLKYTKAFARLASSYWEKANLQSEQSEKNRENIALEAFGKNDVYRMFISKDVQSGKESISRIANFHVPTDNIDRNISKFVDGLRYFFTAFVMGEQEQAKKCGEPAACITSFKKYMEEAAPREYENLVEDHIKPIQKFLQEFM